MGEPRILPWGPDAVLADFGAADHADALALWRALSRSPPKGFREAVLGDGAVALHFDPAASDPEAAVLAIRDALRNPDHAPRAAGPRVATIPVRYGGEDGPDLEEVARAAGLSSGEAVALHAGALYTVRMVGFLPGFPYLDGLPAPLRLPRLATPRTRVPAGSVAIAGEQCGIYPFESPGGWRILGRTGFRLFDPAKDPPALLLPGDGVRFVPLA